jgi:4-alpha-glucanotransferase
MSYVPFFAEKAKEDAIQHFQQDSATANTAHATFEALQEVFDDHVVSHSLWPPKFP